MFRKTARVLVIAGSACLLLATAVSQTALADDPFIGEVKMFGGTFAPRGYALCNGTLISISSNTALFSIIGTLYGGDGRTTMGLPDLRGRVAIHPGSGPGLSSYSLGQRGGLETVTLSAKQMPTHTHTATTALTVSATLKADSGSGDSDAPAGKVLARKSRTKIYSGDAPNVNMHANAIEVSASASTTVNNTGGSQSHENRMPYLAINYIIALQGLYPSRN